MSYWLKFLALVALGTWAVTWFVQWLPCHVDPIICGGPAMPWWWYAIIAVLFSRPVVMFLGRRKS